MKQKSPQRFEFVRGSDACICMVTVDHTRVKLLQRNDDDSDFINANYLPVSEYLVYKTVISAHNAFFFFSYFVHIPVKSKI